MTRVQSHEVMDLQSRRPVVLSRITTRKHRYAEEREILVRI